MNVVDNLDLQVLYIIVNDIVQVDNLDTILWVTLYYFSIVCGNSEEYSWPSLGYSYIMAMVDNYD